MLWLLQRQSRRGANLRREARRAASIRRVWFSPRMRSRIIWRGIALADLFLDTLPYNAHTTASDALWTGVRS